MLLHAAWMMLQLELFLPNMRMEKALAAGVGAAYSYRAHVCATRPRDSRGCSPSKLSRLSAHASPCSPLSHPLTEKKLLHEASPARVSACLTTLAHQTLTYLLVRADSHSLLRAADI